MTEVLRSAIAEVEQYSRVKLVPPVDGTLRGHAVADVIHLLAELVENATVFSAPHTQVLLRANLVTSGLAVEVEDRGLGMPVGEQDRMNALLADPDQVHVASLLADGRIGLFVVSQLARRHGIHVRLQTNIYGGVQAVLVVPQSLLGGEPAAVNGAQGTTASLPPVDGARDRRGVGPRAPGTVDTRADAHHARETPAAGNTPATPHPVAHPGRTPSAPPATAPYPRRCPRAAPVPPAPPPPRPSPASTTQGSPDRARRAGRHHGHRRGPARPPQHPRARHHGQAPTAPPPRPGAHRAAAARRARAPPGQRARRRTRPPADGRLPTGHQPRGVPAGVPASARPAVPAPRTDHSDHTARHDGSASAG
ncbi:ATP-binding protein [Streptomyces thermocarboxydus]